MILILEFIGAVVILVPFALLQTRRTSPHAPSYLWPNLLGAGLLTVVAWLEQQWGFVLVQVVWAAVAAWGLSSRRRRPEAPTDQHVRP